jgi:hypothetical protein
LRPYTDLPGLAEIVLEESYVLGIKAEPGTVTFDMAFVLTPNHPAYSPPPPSETECFRRGTLRLVGVRQLTWTEQGRRPAVDASGEEDWGHVDSFAWDENHFVLTGDFGSLDAEADTVEAALVAR